MVLTTALETNNMPTDNDKKDLPRLLSESEAADFLGVSRKTLQGWRYRGLKPRFRKLHGAVRYALQDLIEFAGGA